MKTATAILLATSAALVGTAGAAFIITNRDGSVVNSKSAFVRANHNRMNLANTAPESPAAFILSEVGNHDVVVFSKTYCPYCTATKTLFDKISGVDARVIELDQRGDGADIQAALLEKTGQRTVPSVFVKGEHIGGNDATQALFKSGELGKKLGIEIADSW